MMIFTCGTFCLVEVSSIECCCENNLLIFRRTPKLTTYANRGNPKPRQDKAKVQEIYSEGFRDGRETLAPSTNFGKVIRTKIDAKPPPFNPVLLHTYYIFEFRQAGIFLIPSIALLFELPLIISNEKTIRYPVEEQESKRLP